MNTNQNQFGHQITEGVLYETGKVPAYQALNGVPLPDVASDSIERVTDAGRYLKSDLDFAATTLVNRVTEYKFDNGALLIVRTGKKEEIIPQREQVHYDAEYSTGTSGRCSFGMRDESYAESSAYGNAECAVDNYRGADYDVVTGKVGEYFITIASKDGKVVYSNIIAY